MMTQLDLGKTFESGGIAFKAPPNWHSHDNYRTLSARLFQDTVQEARGNKAVDGMDSDDNKKINQALFGEFWNPVQIHRCRESQRGRGKTVVAAPGQ